MGIGIRQKTRKIYLRLDILDSNSFYGKNRKVHSHIFPTTKSSYYKKMDRHTFLENLSSAWKRTT